VRTSELLGWSGGERRRKSQQLEAFADSDGGDFSTGQQHCQEESRVEGVRLCVDGHGYRLW
jgi:hypothetical protein